IAVRRRGHLRHRRTDVRTYAAVHAPFRLVNAGGVETVHARAATTYGRAAGRDDDGALVEVDAGAGRTAVATLPRGAAARRTMAPVDAGSRGTSKRSSRESRRPSTG